MGAEFKDEPKVPVKPKETETPKTFGDPDSYKHLSKEERKEMTDRMKNHFLSFGAVRNWSQEKRDA
jgi:hypothetical protein